MPVLDGANSPKFIATSEDNSGRCLPFLPGIGNFPAEGRCGVKAMSQNDDPEIIDSALSQEVTQDGVTVRVLIYRLEDDVTWTLEVVDDSGVSTTWDAPFPTEEDALKEAIATIAKEGIRTFVVAESDRRTLH